MAEVLPRSLILLCWFHDYIGCLSELTLQKCGSDLYEQGSFLRVFDYAMPRMLECPKIMATEGAGGRYPPKSNMDPPIFHDEQMECEATKPLGLGESCRNRGCMLENLAKSFARPES